jgi:plasmid stability protein
MISSSGVTDRMAQLLVRNLDEHVKAKLQQRAKKHRRSTEEEVRDILRSAVKEEVAPPRSLGSRFKRRFARIGLDSDIEELRGQLARPADFRS